MTFIGSDKIIEKKKKYLCPPSFNHFYKNPPQMVKGEMQFMYDSEGKRYLDFFAGVSVMNCGHCNPDILKATIQQMQTLQHTSIIYLTQGITDAAEKLSDVLPGNLTRSFFCCTGSEANETALTMAKLYTGKDQFIALENGLHGRTFQTMSATEIPMWRSDDFLMSNFHFAKSCQYESGTLDEAAEKSIESVERIIESVGSESIAALIAEPIQGNGGIITPPEWYFKKLKALLEKHGILLIIDEVQTGFARTGKMFAIENYNVVPDILTTAKALGNGMPISAASTTDEIGLMFNRPSASTLGGNPVSSATAIAVLDYIKENELCKRAEKLGTVLKEGLLGIQKKHPEVIKDVRGMGLMLGMELTSENGEPLSGLVDQVLEFALERGVIIGKNGRNRNVLAFQPPLVVTERDINCTLEVLEAFFNE